MQVTGTACQLLVRREEGRWRERGGGEREREGGRERERMCIYVLLNDPRPEPSNHASTHKHTHTAVTSSLPPQADQPSINKRDKKQNKRGTVSAAIYSVAITYTNR